MPFLEMPYKKIDLPVEKLSQGATADTPTLAVRRLVQCSQIIYVMRSLFDWKA